MTALPKNYETPEAPSKYMKFQDGDNKFRLLSDVSVGWEYWKDNADGDRKPYRVKGQNDVPEADWAFINEDNPIKHFWVMTVYNHNSKQIQVLEITQNSIQLALEKYDKNPDWGSLRGYNIVVSRERTGSRPMDVKYHVMASPKTKVDEGILKLYEDLHLDMDAWMESKDPFANTDAETAAEDAAKELGGTVRK